VIEPAPPTFVFASDIHANFEVEPWHIHGVDVTTIAREEGMRAPFRLFVTSAVLEFAGGSTEGDHDPTAVVRATIAAIRGHFPVLKIRKNGADIRGFRVSGAIAGAELSGRAHLKLLPDKVFLLSLQQEPFEAN